MKKILILILLSFIVATCSSPPSPFSIMDQYCLEQCNKIESEKTIRALWLGNDEERKITRCECVFEDEFTIIFTAKYKDYEL